MNLSKPGAIVVDQSGQRYLNEGGSYMAFCKAMLERNRTVPAIPSWYVFDQFHYDRYMFAGTMPGAKKPQEWYDSGFLKKADTIEELARLCGIDPASFRRTIEHFNEGARQGRDPQFKRGDRAYDNWLGDAYHKPSSALAPIERPPYYAVPMVPGDVGTYGGVVTDVHGRVMRKDGSPIEGLFATGTTTASVMGRFYPGAGSSIGPAFVFGYIAARYAAHASNLPASTAGPGSRA
jgi:3-oxosteroid 1-dehydrogenase